MLNEWEEFLQYTGPVTYAAGGKRDTTYLGRFTFNMLLDFEGLARVLTIIARGYLFHEAGGELAGNPWERLDYARRALCAWCSVPDEKTAAPKKEWQFVTDFRNLHGEFPALVNEDGCGWFCRHAHRVAEFVAAHPDTVSKSAWEKGQKLGKGFDAVWQKKVRQFQVPLYSPRTKGQWILRFDDALAGALEMGPLRRETAELSAEAAERLQEAAPGVPLEMFCTVVAYCAANRAEDSEWVVLPVTNFDAYFGNSSFGRKYLRMIPETVLERDEAGFGVCRVRVVEEAREWLQR